jgi:hypothetical protein
MDFLVEHFVGLQAQFRHGTYESGLRVEGVARVGLGLLVEHLYHRDRLLAAVINHRLGIGDES